jgi:hypothetical protein
MIYESENEINQIRKKQMSIKTNHLLRLFGLRFNPCTKFVLFHIAGNHICFPTFWLLGFDQQLLLEKHKWQKEGENTVFLFFSLRFKQLHL